MLKEDEESRMKLSNKTKNEECKARWSVDLQNV